MKIAHLVCKFPPYHSGMGTVAFEEAARLSEMGHDVTVFTLSQKENSNPAEINFKIKYLTAFPRFGNGGFCPQIIGQLKSFDIIQLHYPFFGAQEILWLGKKLGLINEKEFKFLWVTDFPLFEYDEDLQRHVAVHHPFTSPKDEDMGLLETQPEKAKAKAYDITLNGVEIGGGSIRIHKRDVQEKVFKALGISKKDAEDKFGFLLDAFKYGAPPHGGIAYGVDRLAAILTGNESIREVIAFPKTKNAESLMEGSPSEVSEEQLKELSLKVNVVKK